MDIDLLLVLLQHKLDKGRRNALPFVDQPVFRIPAAIPLMVNNAPRNNSFLE